MDLIRLSAEMQQKGIRRLVVVSGESQWCLQQALSWMSQLPGDWLWIGDAPQSALHCQPAALRTLLGREFRHAVFDARNGFHAEAFAALTGTLVAGSWLLLLVPEWSRWTVQPDLDSLRWSECPQPVATPHFVHHLQQQLLQDPQVALLLQGEPFELTPVATLPDWQRDAEQQQQRILRALLDSAERISVLTAPRGRGKSALAGMLVQRWPGKCWVTAPAKVSTEVLSHFAGDAFTFYAPDALLAKCEQQPPADIDWLLIDEAAAIPAPVLHRLLRYFPRVLLITTVQGYEGTGRGFLLKFCATLPHVTFYALDMPLRWAQGDPLETVVDRSLLFYEAEADYRAGDLTFYRLEQHDWLTQPERLIALYQLLASAHYRTSPLDLRRMMDGSGMHFIAGLWEEQVHAALWLVDEGGLSAALSEAVWAGHRRPRGNLVAQSLAAHAGFPEAAQMRSRRVSRIAIAASLRRQGIGQRMIQQARDAASHLDFLSVSFGYTEALWRFWQHCGFTLVRFGNQREASSGCYTAMALLPISEAGRQLTQRAAERLERDIYWLQHGIDDPVPVKINRQQNFTQQDWQEVAGFAFAHRSFEASLASLGRLLNKSELSLPALRGAILQQHSSTALTGMLQLSGRKALVALWRNEARHALFALSAAEAKAWQARVQALQ